MTQLPIFPDQKLILVTLLVKLGVAAAVSSALGRSRFFQSLLFNDHRSNRQTVYLVLFVSVPLGLGVWVRSIVPNFLAADISFEATFLTGLVAGRFAGALGGTLMAIPALLLGEWLTLPFNLVVGLIAGQLRSMAQGEDVWSFSPFLDLSLYRLLRGTIPRARRVWQALFFAIILALQLIEIQLWLSYPAKIHSYSSEVLWVWGAILFTAVIVISIPLKIWNNTRNELRLEEQERRLLLSRMEALQNQINPHFLFNTLNSISSLVRIDPDTARDLIVKLASILRRLLRKTDAFVPLREELEFLDDYLDIEQIRFGEKLRVEKQLDPDTEEAMIPNMILQPLVENSLQHGIAPKIEGGTLTIRSYVRARKLVLQVEDDGVGIVDEGTTSGHGIGMANVAERLRVLFGDEGRMTVLSREGEGTLISLELPVMSEDEIPETTGAQALAPRR